MKKLLFLLAVLLLPFAALCDEGLNSYIPLPVPNAIGGLGMNTDSGMASTTADNSVPLMAAVNSRLTTMTNAGTYFSGVAPILSLSQKYPFTNGVSWTPCIKILPVGDVLWDFTAMKTGTLISIYNDNAPSGDFSTYSNGCNNSPTPGGFLGSLTIQGGHFYYATTGISIGDTSAGTGQSNMRMYSMEGVTVNQMGTCLHFTKYNNYMISLRHGQIDGCGTGIDTENAGSVVNSGERINFSDYTIGGNIDGIAYHPQMSFDTVFDNTSLDFVDTVIKCDTNCIYSKNEIINSHIEGIRSKIYNGLAASSQNQFFTLAHSKIIASSNYMYPTVAAVQAAGSGCVVGDLLTMTGGGLLQVATLTGASPNGVATVNILHAGSFNIGSNPSNPVTPSALTGTCTGVTINYSSYLPAMGMPANTFFDGFATAEFNDVYISYSNHSNLADQGMYLFGANITLQGPLDVRFNKDTFKQLISPNLVMNNDAFFNTGTNGQNCNTLLGWTFIANNNMTCTIDNTHSLSAYGGTQGVLLHPTNTSASYEMRSDIINVRPGQRLAADLAVYSDTSSGCAAQGEYEFTSNNGNISTSTSGYVGDNITTLYGQTTDWSYNGAQGYNLKLNTLPTATVPAGYNQAQFRWKISGCGTGGGDIWLIYAGVNPFSQ